LRGEKLNLYFETRNDWLIGISANNLKFEDQTDETYAFYVTSGATNRFRQIGLTLQTGAARRRIIQFRRPAL
jgi:hypothetical protein